MKRPIKLLLWSAAILAGLTISAMVVIRVVFTKEKILAMVTPQLEQALNRPVTVGDAGISFAGGLGVWLGDVTIDNKPGYSNEPLFTIHTLEFKAQLLPLLMGKVRLDRVLLDAPSLLLEFDGEGHSNISDLVVRRHPADTMLSPSSNRASMLLSLGAGRIILTGGELITNNFKSQQRIDLHGINLDMRANLGERLDVITFSADLSVDSFEVSDPVRDWAVSQGIPRAFAAGNYNRFEKSVQLDTLQVDALGAQVAGQCALRSHPGLTEIQFNASLSPTDLKRVSGELLNAGLLQQPPDLEGRISGDMQANFSWPLPEGAIPDWGARFDLTDVRYRPRRWTTSITTPRVELRGDEQTITWSVTSGRIPGGTWSTSGAIDNLFAPDPAFSVHVLADCDSLSWGLASQSGEFSVAGELHLDINAFGPLKTWKALRLSGHCQSPRLVAIDTAWAIDTVALAFDWELAGADLKLSQTDWHSGLSSGHITGTVAGLVPSALGSFRTLDVPRARVEINCPMLNLDELIGETSKAPAVGGGATASPAPFPVISVEGQLACDTLVYSRLPFTEFRSPFTLRENVLSFEPATAGIYGGRAHGMFRWDVNNWTDPIFAAQVNADSVQANDFVTRFLGWADGIYGELQFSGQFTGSGWDHSQILPSLVGSGRASVHSGRLETAPLLMQIGDRLGVKGLDQPRPFRDLLASFKVINGRIVTDTLRFTTDDARWSAMGSFGFDQTLDYVVGITPAPGRSSRLSSLIKGAQLRLGLSGPLASPEITLDVKDVGRAFIENLLTPKDDTSGSGPNVDDLLKDLFRKKKL